MRRLYVEQLAGDGFTRVVRRDDVCDVLAARVPGNPLKNGWFLPEDAPCERLLCWSGGLGEGLFEAHPATWLAPGHRGLRELCARLSPELNRRGLRLCFEPHCRHVLSDVQSCSTFLHEVQGGPFEIALAPLSLLEASMLPQAEDHLRRMFETLGARCAMVILEDSEPESPPAHVLARRELLERLIDRFAAPEVPIVLRGGAGQESTGPTD